MRSRIIPAQITTIEDKIAGSLSFTQLFILMIPVFWTTNIFLLLPPRLHVDVLKLSLSFIVLLISLILAFRFKGRVIASWLIILLRYIARPRWYVLDKNDSYLRNMYLPINKRKQKQIHKAKFINEKQSVKQASLAGVMQLDRFITDPAYSFSLKMKKKGGLRVALKQV